MHREQNKQEKVNLRGMEERKREIALPIEENGEIPFDEDYDGRSLRPYFSLSVATWLIGKRRTTPSDGLIDNNQLSVEMKKCLQ